MNIRLLSLVLAAGLAMTQAAGAQSEASTPSAISRLPIASVIFGASVATTASIAVGTGLSAAAKWTVKSVEASARGTFCVLERASDGALLSVEFAGRGVANLSLAAGTLVTVSAIGAGMVLSVAGEAIAFAPNAVGRALLHNERVTF